MSDDKQHKDSKVFDEHQVAQSLPKETNEAEDIVHRSKTSKESTKVSEETSKVSVTQNATKSSKTFQSDTLAQKGITDSIVESHITKQASEVSQFNVDETYKPSQRVAEAIEPKVSGETEEHRKLSQKISSTLEKKSQEPSERRLDDQERLSVELNKLKNEDDKSGAPTDKRHFKKAEDNQRNVKGLKKSSESVENEIFIRKDQLSEMVPGESNSGENSFDFDSSHNDKPNSPEKGNIEKQVPAWSHQQIISEDNHDQKQEDRWKLEEKTASNESLNGGEKGYRPKKMLSLIKTPKNSQENYNEFPVPHKSNESLLRRRDNQRSSEILIIEPGLNGPITDSSESLVDPTLDNSICILIIYAIMGFLSNYQRTTIRTANLDFLYNIQTMSKNRDERRLIGEILIVEYVAELFEDSLTDQLGISTTRKLHICLSVSLFGFLMLYYADTNSKLLWGIGSILFSMSMSFNSMIDHLKLFHGNAAKFFNIGLQFAHIVAPGAYYLLTSVLEPKARLWPFIVIPVLDVIIFFAFLRSRELKKYEEMLPRNLNMMNIPGNILISQFCGAYSILGPFTLSMCLQSFSSQGIFAFVSYNDNDNAEKFRWYNTMLRIGHFFGAGLAFFIWTTHTWPIPWLSFLNMAILMVDVLTDIKLEGVLVLILWDGFLSGFGEMCALKAVRFFDMNESGNTATDLRLVRKLRKIAGLVGAIALKISDDLLSASIF